MKRSSTLVGLLALLLAPSSLAAAAARKPAAPAKKPAAPAKKPAAKVAPSPPDAGVASVVDAGVEPAPAEEEPPPPEPEEEATSDEPDLEARVAALEEELAETKLTTQRLAQEAEAASALRVEVSGYVDVGFFYVSGNGSGVRKDYRRIVTGAEDVLASWAFVGDPLSTTINSRGDVADLGDSRALAFDPIHSQGRPGFIVNALNLGLSGAVGDEVTMLGLVDFLPRDALLTGAAFGDFIDVKLAWVRWEKAVGEVRFAFSAGKFDSLHGFEYRTQEAPARLTVTPSLICRYTCGRPVGLKGQLFLLEGALEVAVALTNGSTQQELFPWSNETDWNGFKTVHARVLGRLPVGLELTASGALGAQDRQPDDSLLQWHVGAGARLTVAGLLAQAEVVGGRAPGKTVGEVACGAASCIAYVGAYGLLAYKFAHLVSPYVRVDWRASTMRAGREYAYESNEIRTTLGVRVEPVRRLTLKAEYVFNTELFGTPFPDDVFTSSVVVAW